MKNLINKMWYQITVNQMALSGIFIAIIILSKLPFFQINFGVMRMGTEYIWLILVGLLFYQFLGIITVTLGDTFGMLANGQIGTWHYVYFLIPIIIYLLTFGLKNMYKIKSRYILSFTGLALSSTIATVIFVMLILEKDFIKTGSASNALNLTKTMTQVLIWTMFTLMSIGTTILFMLFFFNNSSRWRNIYVTYLIVSIVIVVSIWMLGPLANVLWLTDIGVKFKGSNHYWDLYSTYQIPRILKTPVILPIYVLIISPTYAVINKVILHNYKW